MKFESKYMYANFHIHINYFENAVCKWWLFHHTHCDNPTNTQRKKRVIITSKRRFEVLITRLLHCVFAENVLYCEFASLVFQVCWSTCFMAWKTAMRTNHWLLRQPCDLREKRKVSWGWNLADAVSIVTDVLFNLYLKLNGDCALYD